MATFSTAGRPTIAWRGSRSGRSARRTGGRWIQAAAVPHFGREEREIFINTLPWLDQEQTLRLCARPLATAILFDQCPRGATAAALRALVERPPELGISYPANAVWRYWAL